MKFQTKDKTIRTVFFSPEKHHKCKASAESSSPIKISKYQLKRNQWTDEEEIHVNKRSRVDDPAPSEVTFDIQEQAVDESGIGEAKPGLTSISSLMEGMRKSLLKPSPL